MPTTAAPEWPGEAAALPSDVPGPELTSPEDREACGTAPCVTQSRQQPRSMFIIRETSPRMANVCSIGEKLGLF